MPGYLDAASGAPLRPVAREALVAALQDGWADPDRLYGAARRARLLLDAARESVAACLDARADEVSFTANGTQALHGAVLGALAGAGTARGRRLVHSAVEHSAVLHAAQRHVALGGEALAVGVDGLARVDVAEFVGASRAQQCAVAALQAANHEVGTLQPVAQVASAIPVPLVVDATQLIGHGPLPDGWAVLAGDARTWGGPTVGVLAVRTGTRWRSPWPADERESGRAPGVPNVPAVLAAAAALREAVAERDTQATRHRELVARIRDRVPATVPDTEVLGDPDDRLPHVVTFSCLYVDGEALLTGLDRRGFAVSSGSSCTASTLEPSHVLVAMGALTSGNVRVSLHHETSEDEVQHFLAVLPEAVAEVRAQLGAAGL